MNKIQPVRGTHDWFGKEKLLFNVIVEKARGLAQRYDFQELDTPVLEASELFERNLGETSDVMTKEVYSFRDRGDNQLTLRPEFTAGVVRAFLSNPELQQKLPVRLFSAGPVFRYDRPQKGRYRQFHQLNFECLGEDNVYTDAEIIAMLFQLLDAVLHTEYITLEINNLGDDDSRSHYTAALVNYLQQYQTELSPDSQQRLLKNPLRILDSKDEKDQAILQGAPTIDAYYSSATQARFEKLLALIQGLHINFKVNPELVRGLDYYTSTVFEFTTEQLGAQGTVLAGGRYDKLANQLGYGKPLPSIGAAAGIERLLLLSKLTPQPVATVGVILLGDTDAVAETGFLLRENLRRQQVVKSYSGNNVKKLLAKASEDKVQTVYLLGENELAQHQVKIKDMQTGTEQLQELQNYIVK